MEIKFRPAVIDDAKYVIPLMYSAAPVIHDFLYKNCSKNTNDFLEYSFKSGKSFFGYKKQIVGVYEDKIVFSATVYNGNEFLKLTLESLILHSKFFSIADMLKIIKKSLVINKIFTPPASDSKYFANIGTEPKFRSKGIATQFFIQQHELAKGEGIKKCDIDVSINNPNAQKLYEKMGYKVIFEKKSHSKDFSDGMKRMQLRN